MLLSILLLTCYVYCPSYHGNNPPPSPKSVDSGGAKPWKQLAAVCQLGPGSPARPKPMHTDQQAHSAAPCAMRQTACIIQRVPTTQLGHGAHCQRWCIDGTPCSAAPGATPRPGTLCVPGRPPRPVPGIGSLFAGGIGDNCNWWAFYGAIFMLFAINARDF